MTAKQEAYAKQLRQTIMAIARGYLKWSAEEAHGYFIQWGFGDSLRKLDVGSLRELETQIASVAGIADPKRCRHTPTAPGAPLKEFKPKRPSAAGMATPKQLAYAGILAKRYAEKKGIPQEKAFEAWHAFVSKYQKIDHLMWCTKQQATKVIAVMERVFITTFDNDAFYELTGHTWQYRGTTYQKYNKPRGERNA